MRISGSLWALPSRASLSLEEPGETIDFAFHCGHEVGLG